MREYNLQREYHAKHIQEYMETQAKMQAEELQQQRMRDEQNVTNILSEKEKKLRDEMLHEQRQSTMRMEKEIFRQEMQ